MTVSKQNNVNDFPMIYRGKESVTKHQLVSMAQQLAVEIADCEHVINLCGDRFNFTLGFVAALISNTVTVLPPNSQRGTIENIVKRFDKYCVFVDCDGFADFPNARDLRTQMGDQHVQPLEKIESLAKILSSADEHRVAVIAFTSGSTGEPKAQEKPLKTLLAASSLLGTRLQEKYCARDAQASLKDTSKNTCENQINVVATVPSQHMYGLEMTAMMAVRNGWAISANKPFFPEDIAQELLNVPEPRFLVTTPVHLRALVGSGIQLPPIEKIVSATAPLSQKLAEKAEQQFATQVHEVYGCTEAGSMATRRTTNGATWRLLDGLSLQQRGEETYVCGDHLAGEALLNDIIDLQDDVHFRLLGRSNDVLNVAGKRSSLAELNEKLLAIAGVDDGVIFMPADSGEKETRPAALVVTQNLSESTILHTLSETVDPVFLPRPLKLVDALPRNTTGKLPTKALMSLLQSKQQGGASE